MSRSSFQSRTSLFTVVYLEEPLEEDNTHHWSGVTNWSTGERRSFISSLLLQRCLSLQKQPHQQSCSTNHKAGEEMKLNLKEKWLSSDTSDTLWWRRREFFMSFTQEVIDNSEIKLQNKMKRETARQQETEEREFFLEVMCEYVLLLIKLTSVVTSCHDSDWLVMWET